MVGRTSVRVDGGRNGLRSPRVLLVPDSLFWVTGEIAHEIARYNTGFEFTVCPSQGLKWLFRRRPAFPGRFDLVHFLTPELFEKCAPRFDAGVARVATLFHAERPEHFECVRGSDAVMTASKQWRERLVARGIPPEKVFLVPLGTDPELFHPPTPEARRELRAELRIGADALVVGFCAKRSSDVAGRKGVDVFARAMEELGHELSGVVALLIGPGWTEFAAERSRAGVEFRCLPFLLEREKLARVYRALDLFWVTSRIEGGPAPLLEAMSSGVCCLTTPVGIAEEVVENGRNGFLVPFDAASRFAEVSARLAHDADGIRAIAEAARAAILAERSWRATAPAAGELYRTVLERKGFDGRREDVSGPLDAHLVPQAIAAQEHAGFARSLAKMGDLESAAAFSRAALHMDPLNPERWRHWMSIAWQRARRRRRRAPRSPG